MPRTPHELDGPRPNTSIRPPKATRLRLTAWRMTTRQSAGDILAAALRLWEAQQPTDQLERVEGISRRRRRTSPPFF